MNLPKKFEQTSEKLYDRHDYKLIFSNGKSKVFDNYEDLRHAWWETPSQFLTTVEVLDKKTEKKTSKGFL